MIFTIALVFWQLLAIQVATFALEQAVANNLFDMSPKKLRWFLLSDTSRNLYHD